MTKRASSFNSTADTIGNSTIQCINQIPSIFPVYSRIACNPPVNENSEMEIEETKRFYVAQRIHNVYYLNTHIADIDCRLFSQCGISNISNEESRQKKDCLH